ncbi:MAG: hypothetical protein Q8P45_00170 [Candidatus Harrisonbacteria bacterium]|nr:hypothetical protein [Candidatus Harrisonbacteria bacterium]
MTTNTRSIISPPLRANPQDDCEKQSWTSTMEDTGPNFLRTRTFFMAFSPKILSRSGRG